jgi:DNA polymerase-3 subunit gamma/tau
VPIELLAEHYAKLAVAEGVNAEPAAIALVARAADGSVRDGLSLLDQAIALSGGKIGEATVRDMLGIADRGLVFDLLEAAFHGDAAEALKRMNALYQGGADPSMVLQDLLDLTHFLTRLKVVPTAGEGDPALEGDRARGLALAQKLGMPALTRAWQMLLKGLQEAQSAPSALQAAEMVLVRLAYVADLPAPADLVRLLRDPAGVPATSGVRSAPAASGGAMAASPPMRVASPDTSGATTASRLALREPVAEAAPALPQPRSFVEVIDLFDKFREAVLRAHLYSHVHLVRFEPGRIELRPQPAAPRDLPNRLGQLLSEWTGERWVVSVSSEPGAPTLREEADAKARMLKSEAASHPLVSAVLEAFPGARIEAVRELAIEDPAASEPIEDGGPDGASDEAGTYVIGESEIGEGGEFL